MTLQKYKALSFRERAEVENRWLKNRLDTILPEIMKRERIDMWIVVAREHREDPVTMTLLPKPMISADGGLVLPPTIRWMFLVFSLGENGKLKRTMINGPGFVNTEGFYEQQWPQEVEDEWDALGRVVKDYDPQIIGVNYSDNFALADGLTYIEHDHLTKALGNKYNRRMKSAERLAIGWLESRSKQEIDIYDRTAEIAHDVISEAFSSRVIHPGITSVSDVSWWIRTQFREIGYSAWFHPMVMAIRYADDKIIYSRNETILPGDMLHCDVGLSYLGLKTDMQELAYVLKAGEDDAPTGLKAGMASGNRLQDILAEEYVAFRSGNDILQKALSRACSEGLEPRIWTHPIGYHGHGAGPAIGYWNRQDGVSGNGDYELYDNTCYAMELSVTKTVPEWGNNKVTFNMEQTIAFTGGKVQFLGGRQTKFHLI